MKETNVYVENGYKDREDYLECLADDYNVDLAVVKAIANLYGESEDFDGLVSTLVDMSDFIF